MPAAPIPPYEPASARASPWKRALAMSVAGHVALVLLLIVGPVLARLLRPPPTREMITFVELAPIPPAPPTPAPAPEPEPRKPEPRMSPIPEKPPERPKPPEKPKIQVNTNRIVRKPEPQPPRPQPQRPALTPEQIRKLLEANIRFSPAGAPAANVTDLSIYYATVRDAMYGAWEQPSAVARGLRAEASIRVLRNGAVTQRRLTRSSGSKLMDDSVMQAVNSVAMLRPLPAEIRDPHLDITIEFIVGE
jgi:TonB family protein